MATLSRTRRTRLNYLSLKFVLTYYDGDCNDNTADAQIEIKKTFKQITSMVESAGHGNLLTVNGVSAHLTYHVRGSIPHQ